MNHRMNPQYQEDIAAFASREVFYCVSALVTKLTENPEALDPAEYDELLSICVNNRCRECAGTGAAKFFIELECEKCDHEWRHEADNEIEIDAAGEFRCPECGCAQFTGSDVEIEECPHCDDGEAHTALEAYEHWLVSNWLADKLIEKGEMVSKDIMGLTIWGRCTTGQSISADCVIEDIYDELRRQAIESGEYGPTGEAS